MPRACALQQERPPQGEAHALQERTPAHTTGESPPAATKTQCSQGVKAIFFFFFLKKEMSLLSWHIAKTYIFGVCIITPLFRIKLTFQLPIDPHRCSFITYFNHFCPWSVGSEFRYMMYQPSKAVTSPIGCQPLSQDLLDRKLYTKCLLGILKVAFPTTLQEAQWLIPLLISACSFWKNFHA